jgi:predicted RNase H-like HicB family nuclease
MSQTWETGLNRTYECDAIVCEEAEGGYSVHALQLAGVVSQGDDFAEAIANFTEAFRGVILSYLASGATIPWRKGDPEFFSEMKIAGTRRIAVDV